MDKSSDFGEFVGDVQKATFRVAKKAGHVIQKTGSHSSTGAGVGFFLGGAGHVIRTTGAVAKGVRDAASLLSFTQFSGECRQHGTDWAGAGGTLGGFTGLCSGIAEVCQHWDNELESARKRLKGD